MTRRQSTFRATALLAAMALLPAEADAQAGPSDAHPYAEVSRQQPEYDWQDDWQSWFPASEIPQAARRRRFSYEARVQLEVSAEGRPTSCRLLRPSGLQALDALVCPRFMERGRFAVHYDVPGIAAGHRPVMAVLWADSEPERIVTPPPPPISAIRQSEWPRSYWDDRLELVEIPDIPRADDPAGSMSDGVTSFDIVVDPRRGITDCIVGLSGGSSARDAAACGVGRNLRLRYIESCDGCAAIRLPIQIVWRRDGGFIRFPLRGPYVPRAGERPPLRDPRDTRTLTQHRAGYVHIDVAPAERRLVAQDIGYNTYALYMPRQYDVIYDGRGNLIDCALSAERPTGRPSRGCALLRARGREFFNTDVFGDPIAGRMAISINVDDELVSPR